MAGSSAEPTDAASNGPPSTGQGATGPPRAFLAGEGLRPLWLAAHRRLERAGLRPAGVAVRLDGLDHDERAAVDRLLGVRSRGRTVQVSLEKLDALLRERTGRSLLEVVAEMVGPLRDRPGERAAVAVAEQAMWDRLAAVAAPVIEIHPDLAEWLSRSRTTGRWRRLDQPERTLTDVLTVLAELPQPERRSRAGLAAEILGDAHALDDDHPVGRLVLSVLATGRRAAASESAAQRRRLWADQGVVSDETSSTVLTVGLRPDPVGPLTRAAADWGATGVPLPLPLAAVQAEQWRVAVGTPIWVCENPSVLAAAAATGATVVSLEGWPSLAATLLLESLVAAGARLRYHGDFGSGGIAIANHMVSRLGAEPWRLGADDHAEALSRARSTGVQLRPLRGPVPDAVWDDDLAPAIRRCGTEVEEELILDLLLADLG